MLGLYRALLRFGEGLVRDGLCLLVGGEEKELGDPQSAGTEGIIVELCKEPGGTAGVEAQAVADLERDRHPG